VKRKMNPKAKKIGAFNTTELPHKVANQLNILIPVGIAIIIVAAVKYALVSISRPTVYMW
jgi:cellobiose-specific phosphotransferase system component IIC